MPGSWHGKHLRALQRTSGWIELVSSCSPVWLVYDGKWCRCLAIIKDVWKRAVVELPNHLYEPWRTAKLFHNLLQVSDWQCWRPLSGWRMLYNSTFCSLDFSWNCLAAKIIWIDPRCFLKPHWLSGNRLLWRCDTSRFKRILAITFPAMERRDIPLLLSQDWQFSLHL